MQGSCFFPSIQVFLFSFKLNIQAGWLQCDSGAAPQSATTIELTSTVAQDFWLSLQALITCIQYLLTQSITAVGPANVIIIRHLDQI